MGKFRKRPVVVEAEQTQVQLQIETLEGTMTASPGDWIITGVNGERYPCKPDIFAKTYEPVPCNEPDPYECCGVRGCSHNPYRSELAQAQERIRELETERLAWSVDSVKEEVRRLRAELQKMGAVVEAAITVTEFSRLNDEGTEYYEALGALERAVAALESEEDDGS